MENFVPGKLAMYLAVKAACEAKPAVWRRSGAFSDAFADFCGCVERLVRWQPTVGIFHSAARAIAVETTVADTILVTEMDELMEQFEPVDVVFVDDYTAARSLEFPEEIPAERLLPTTA